MKVLSPPTLRDLLEAKSEHGRDAALVAGATDLGVRLRGGMEPPEVLLSTGLVASPDLDQASAPAAALESAAGEIMHDGFITFGVQVTHRSIEHLGAGDPLLRGLAEACRTIGSVQTRNVGTLIGNIANASPAADAVTALVSLGATVTLQHAAGGRELPLSDFGTGPGRTVLEPHEVITRVQVRTTPGHHGTAFRKLGRRRAMEISIVSAAAHVRLDNDGLVDAVAVSLGAVGPTVIAVPDVLGMLHGRTLTDPDTDDALDALAHAAARVAQPRSDHRASAAYRREMVEVLARRVVTDAWKRAANRGDSHD